MGLKILHSADWHLDSPFVGFTEQQRQFLKEAQLQIPGKIADLCRKEDCDMVLLAGDIFDGEARPETVVLLKRELKRCGVPVLIAPGNHAETQEPLCSCISAGGAGVYISPPF